VLVLVLAQRSATFGALGCLGIGGAVDRWFYGFWAWPFMGSFHFNVLLGE